MNDLDIIREFRADVGEPDAAHLAPLRGQLLDEARPRPKLVGVIGLRRLLIPVVSATAAVAVGLGALTLPTPGFAPKPGARAERQINAANVSAVTLLNRAADHVEQQLAVQPQPEQWVYQKTLVPRGTQDGFEFDTWESWQRADGQQMRTANSVGGVAHDTGVAETRSEGDDRSPVEYGSDLKGWPHEPAELLKKLSGGAIETEAGRARAFWALASVLRDYPLIPPERQASIYRALALIPGVVSQSAKDAAGRSGIAIGRRDLATDKQGAAGKLPPEVPEFLPTRFDVILDPTTYVFLGHRIVALSPVPDKYSHDGQLVGLSARLAVGVVDSPYERP